MTVLSSEQVWKLVQPDRLLSQSRIQQKSYILEKIIMARLLGLIKVQKRLDVFGNRWYSGFLISISVTAAAMVVEVCIMVTVAMTVRVIMIVSVRMCMVMMVISGLLHDDKSFLMNAGKHIT